MPPGNVATLLATAREMAAASVNDPTASPDECPQREWEAGLRLMAEMLAQHSRTRSAEEIVAFMNHEEARARKAHASLH